MGIKHKLRTLLWKVGYDVSRFTPTSHPLARRRQILSSYAIDTVLDIGANAGQFAVELRHDLGYRGRILSFEPVSAPFSVLAGRARKDPSWEVFKYALGDVAGSSEINVAGNSYSSSLLSMLPSHLKSAPESAYVSKETIEIKTLDSVFEALCSTAKNVFMKLDTQGFEDKVLKGAANSLARIDTVQVELSLVPLYGEQLLIDEMYELLRDEGFSLVAMEPNFTDPINGQLLQIDGIFRRLGTKEPDAR